MNWSESLKRKLKPITEVKPPTQYRVVAAVLIPIGHHAVTGKDEILLTKRTELVLTHKGQISFPGGMFEISDEHLLNTAIRETEEEIGLGRKNIEVLGMLEPVTTLRDTLIFPWVAKVEFPKVFKVSPTEVKEILYLSVERLVTEGLGWHSVSVDLNGNSFHIKSIGLKINEDLVWGASAKMLEQIKNHLQG